MSRPSSQHRLNLERLEAREVQSSGGPSAQAQYMLELINEARTNPAAAAERVTTNLSKDVETTLKFYNVDPNQARNEIASIPSRQPLAWSSELATAAQKQSQDQANTGRQSHDGSDGSNLDTRLDRVGYDDRAISAENAYAYAESVDHAMQAFLIDWGVPGKGHLNNILQPGASNDQSYREVGIGLVKTSNNDLGPLVVTQNFGRQDDSKPLILGVAFDDKNDDNFYNPGEGKGDVTVQVTNVNNGQTKSVQTWDAGGYQVPVDPGQYKVTAKVGDQVVKSESVQVQDQNEKVDFILSNPWQAPTPAAPKLTPLAPPRLATNASVNVEPTRSTPKSTPTTPTTVSDKTTPVMVQAQTPPPTYATEAGSISRPLPILNSSRNGVAKLGFITNWKTFRARSNG